MRIRQNPLQHQLQPPAKEELVSHFAGEKMHDIISLLCAYGGAKGLWQARLMRAGGMKECWAAFGRH